MKFFAEKLIRNRAIVSQDICNFLRQFSTLFAAGVSIIQCFEMLEKTESKHAMRLLVYSIKRDLLSGKDLYTSLRRHNTWFDGMTCQLVRIGEQTGKLEEMLKRIVDEKEKQLVLIKQVQQAMLYPCLIGMTAVFVTLSLFWFVIPRFAELFAGSQLTLPLITRLIFSASRGFQEYGFILLIVPAIPVIFKNKLKAGFLQLPFIKPFLAKVRLARFTRSLALTSAAGMPLTDALKLMVPAEDKDEFSDALIQLGIHLHSGLQLHQAMVKVACFPDLMIQMVRIGEETGRLDHLLIRLADIVETDIFHIIQRLGKLLEPLIMLVLGVLIGGLVIGMYLPLFKLGNVL